MSPVASLPKVIVTPPRTSVVLDKVLFVRVKVFESVSRVEPVEGTDSELPPEELCMLSICFVVVALPQAFKAESSAAIENRILMLSLYY